MNRKRDAEIVKVLGDDEVGRDDEAASRDQGESELEHYVEIPMVILDKPEPIRPKQKSKAKGR